MDEALRRRITLGREHYRARDYDAAEKILVEVLASHTGFADIYNMLGVIWHDRGKLAEAKEAFEQALRLNPAYTEAALNLSVTYNDLGLYPQAREVYTKVIQRARSAPRSLDPFVKGKLANMHADLGAAYAESGLYPEAVREYGKALELCPAFVDLRTRLAAVYRDMGDAAAAVRELDIVKTMQPRYVPARLALGTALFTLGRRDDAIREWEAARELEPDNKPARLYLGMARDLDKPRDERDATAEGEIVGDASLSEGSLDRILGGLDESVVVDDGLLGDDGGGDPSKSSA
jgi:tetratricopeptide (TPR) repeat protein